MPKHLPGRQVGSDLNHLVKEVPWVTFSSLLKVPIYDSEVSTKHMELERKTIQQPQSQRIEMRQ